MVWSYLVGNAGIDGDLLTKLDQANCAEVGPTPSLKIKVKSTPRRLIQLMTAMYSIPKDSGKTDVRLMLGIDGPKDNHEWARFEVVLPYRNMAIKVADVGIVCL